MITNPLSSQIWGGGGGGGVIKIVGKIIIFFFFLLSLVVWSRAKPKFNQIKTKNLRKWVHTFDLVG
jgi:hypothetical protein